MESHKPLIVDLDGSLLRTDTLHEGIAAAMRHPGRLIRSAQLLRRSGKAAMKQELAAHGVDLRDAPMNTAVLELITRRAEAGGAVILASGADANVAGAIAERVPDISLVLSSDGDVNLTGRIKSDALVARYGEKGFDYVGNSPTDVSVWETADQRFLATLRPSGLPRWARGMRFDEILRDPSPGRLAVWVRAIRVHQALKNVLIFLPLIAAHEFTNPALLTAAAGGFVSFSLMAFAVYLLNDTLDLAADRAHYRKSSRPLAAGWISPLSAVVVATLLAAGAIVLAILLGPGFLAILLVYAAMTTSYSFWLKRITLIDVVVLALLYMIRIVAGSVVTGIPLSFWFTAVTLFLFLSLALVKRYAEAHQARAKAGAIPGRGYSGDDVHAILALGAAAGVAAVLLAAVYIESDAVALIYPAPTALWLVIPAAFYWVANLWLKAGRGEMHDDPLVFALRDRASLLAAAVIVLAFVAASFPATADLLPTEVLR